MAAPPRLPDRFTHPQATGRVMLGTTDVAYQLQRSHRRTLGLRVDEQGLTVHAPVRARQTDIEQALQAKARWILSKLVQQHERRRQQAALAIHWQPGTQLPCLGGTLTLHLAPTLPHHQGPTLVSLLSEAASGQAVSVNLDLALPTDASVDALRTATADWLQTQALAVFQQRCAVYAPHLDVRPTHLALSSARTRWGSATANGTIRLHWHLIHFALPVIDYVVVHELAHLRQMNHSPAFWALVHRFVPDVAACQTALRHNRPGWWTSPSTAY